MSSVLDGARMFITLSAFMPRFCFGTLCFPAPSDPKSRSSALDSRRCTRSLGSEAPPRDKGQGPGLDANGCDKADVALSHRLVVSGPR